MALLAVKKGSLADNEDNVMESRAKGQRKQDTFLLLLVTFLDRVKSYLLSSLFM